jgi:hypothetical protein
MHNVGEFNYDNIVQANKYGSRIFTLGVGTDVDPALMEKVAKMNRGDFIAIKDTAKLETTLSSFYKKISRPSLVNLTAEFKGMSPVMTYPDLKDMPDLFIGSQLIVIGRYEQSGKGEIIIKGELNQKEKTFRYKTEFADRTDEKNAFLPRVWAQKRIDYLMSEITRNGEKEELKNEVIALGEKFNLVTPYTSLLMVDQGVAKNDQDLAMEDNKKQQSSVTVGGRQVGSNSKDYSNTVSQYNSTSSGKGDYNHTLTMLNSPSLAEKDERILGVAPGSQPVVANNTGIFDTEGERSAKPINTSSHNGNKNNGSLGLTDITPQELGMLGQEGMSNKLVMAIGISVAIILGGLIAYSFKMRKRKRDE